LQDAGLSDRLNALMQTRSKMQQRIDRFEGQLRKNSRNYHRPPASDRFNKPAQRLLRNSSGREPGGQAWHGGYWLKGC
jgi:hypothetical protein